MGAGLLEYDALLVDLDGVVWRGSEVIQPNVNALRLAQESGVKLVFLTNNSTRSRRLYADILRGLGLEARIDTVITSGYSSAMLIRERGLGERVYPIGEAGLYEELSMAGLTAVTGQEALSGGADVVVVALDRELTYTKLEAGVRSILSGSVFLAANTDRVIPVGGGLVSPGAGSIVAAVEAAVGRPPDFIAGKPSKWMAKLGIQACGGGRILVIGDRLDTDVAMAKAAGLDSALVLTGVSRREDAMNAPADRRPDYIVATLEDLVP